MITMLITMQKSQREQEEKDNNVQNENE